MKRPFRDELAEAEALSARCAAWRDEVRRMAVARAGGAAWNCRRMSRLAALAADGEAAVLVLRLAAAARNGGSSYSHYRQSYSQA